MDIFRYFFFASTHKELHREHWLSMTAQGFAAVVVAAVVLLVALPSAMHYVLEASDATELRLTAELDELSVRQKAMLDSVLNLQDRVATLQHTVLAMSTGPPAVGSGEAKESLVDDALEQDETVASFKKEAKQAKADIAAVQASVVAQLEDLRNLSESHYLVKFHGKDGIQTLPRFRDQAAAQQAFEEVGEFAKKLLMYDSQLQQWSVLREYGGENWLKMLSNDGTMQNDAKPKSNQ